MGLIDGHCHLANLNALLPVEPLLEEASQSGITGWLSSALHKSEVRWYRQRLNPQIKFSAGIHPNFDTCDLELEDIAKLCADKEIWAVGEIGLDRNNPDLEWQKRTLLAQLELAAQYNLPVVLHLIGFQQQAYEILRAFPLRYLVHSYAGSLDGYRLLCRLESVFTISERILRPDKLALLQEIVARGAFLFETDITQYYVLENEPNPLLRLLAVHNITAELTGLKRDRLLELQTTAYHELTGVSG